MPQGDHQPETATALWLPGGVPTQLGMYRLVRSLGAGGMGMVFEARHELLGQRAAVKVLLPRFAQDPDFASRFRREMAALGKLRSHPNLVRAHYAGEEGGVLYLAMDLVAGQSLSQILKRGAMPPAEACEAIRQAALGLEVVREAGLVHRDIKPANLMLATDGTVKILDLGLARLREPEPLHDELTSTNMNLGTFDYQAPEQADDPRSVDIRADIYSLGCTLYCLLAGRPPYADHASPARKIHAHAHLALPALAPGCPPGLETVLGRMTAKDPDQRYATPLEVAQALRPFARGAVLPAREADSSTDPEVQPSDKPDQTPTFKSPRRMRHLLLAGLAFAALVPLALALCWPSGGTDAPGDRPAVVPEPRRAEKEPLLRPVALPVGEGLLPAGSPLRRLDDLAVAQKHDLLALPPVECHWVPGGAAFRQYDPLRRQLMVNSPGTSLLHLGTLARPSYSFSVRIDQSRWASGTGVYLGYRETGDRPPKIVAHFQVLLFGERTAPNGAQIPHLARGSGKVGIQRGKALVGRTIFNDAPLPVAIQSRVLAFTVVGGSLKSVTVDGKELPRLTSAAVNQSFKPADYQGGFGFINLRNNSVYRQAFFQPR